MGLTIHRNFAQREILPRTPVLARGYVDADFLRGQYCEVPMPAQEE
jgi:hypothetical protein